MTLEEIDHVALYCAEPERTMEWYINTLGFKHVFPGQWSGVPIFIQLGSTFLALFPLKEAKEHLGKDRRVSHLAFRAATHEKFDSAQAELKSKGIPFEFEDHDISHSIYFRDLDGFLLEITTYDVSP